LQQNRSRPSPLCITGFAEGSTFEQEGSAVISSPHKKTTKGITWASRRNIASRKNTRNVLLFPGQPPTLEVGRQTVVAGQLDGLDATPGLVAAEVLRVAASRISLRMLIEDVLAEFREKHAQITKAICSLERLGAGKARRRRTAEAEMVAAVQYLTVERHSISFSSQNVEKK
jgi:hypothetical protein